MSWLVKNILLLPFLPIRIGWAVAQGATITGGGDIIMRPLIFLGVTGFLYVCILRGIIQLIEMCRK
jgi:hypothetical protein